MRKGLALGNNESIYKLQWSDDICIEIKTSETVLQTGESLWHAGLK